MPRVSAGGDLHDFKARPPSAWLFDLLGRRWVRVLLISLGLVLLANAIWFETVVEPELTATRLELSVEGRGDRLLVSVDDEAGVVTVTGGQNGLSELVMSGDSLLVLAIDVGLSGEADRWVRVPLSMIDARVGALTSDRSLLALSRDVKECRKPSSDAAFILGLLLGASDEGVSLCGVGTGAADGKHWLVDESAVRPSEVPGVPSSSILELSDTPAPEHVLSILNRLMARASP